MPRTARSIQAGFVYHVVNRGNRRAQFFHDDGDHDAFVRLLAQAIARFPVRLLGFCLMPNHMHAALWPETDDGLSALMHWLLTTHAVRYLRSHRATGHVWQGRFKAFPIQENEHLLTVIRYIERNPLRAGLVALAEAWRWSSLRWRLEPPKMSLLDAGPIPWPTDWLTHVNTPQTEAELEALRRCVERGTPFGDAAWVGPTAARLGLEHTLRPRGRPAKRKSAASYEAAAGSLFSQAAEE